MIKSKEIQLSKYIIGGLPELSQFKIVEIDVPELQKDQVLIRNLWMSVDPYMRGRMVNRESYIEPFALSSALQGGSIGIIEESQHEGYLPGEIVSSFNGWREYFLSDGNDIEKIKSPPSNLQHYLGALGMPGLTAYGGLLSIGKPRKGETVFVSAATGAVGSLVCQIAKLKGCKVIASAGSTEKVKWLQEDIKVDFAFNYKECSSIDATLKEAVPDGIDIYFDNVGGEHLQAAINNMRHNGRAVMCGMISQYNLEKPELGPNNLMQIIAKRLTLQGFIAIDFEPLKADFYNDMNNWIQSGQVKIKESIADGIENAPQAFIDLFSGENFGKMLVKLSTIENATESS